MARAWAMLFAIGAASHAGTPAPVTFRFYGVFQVDNTPDEGRSGVPRAALQLKVDGYRSEAKARRAMEKEYPELTWETIDRNYRGAYGFGAPLRKRFGKRAALTGVVYDRCGQGLYLRSAAERDADCLVADQPTHVELLDRKGRPLKMKVLAR